VAALAEPAMPAGATDDLPSLTLRELFDAHAGFVFRVLRRLGVAEGDLDDAAQDVFVVVHRNLSQYDHQCALRSWLFGIVYRVAASHRRRVRRRREDVRADVPVEAVQASQLDRVALAEAHRLLLDALDELEPERRAVFILYELEEMTMPEVARAVGCPLKTAYSRLYAARDSVRAHILRAHGARR
jgi:RNA polymerase sigma-70 factor, ECF subfamily